MVEERLGMPRRNQMVHHAEVGVLLGILVLPSDALSIGSWDELFRITLG